MKQLSTTEQTTPDTHQERARTLLRTVPKQLLIGGRWVGAKSGKTFETVNPATEDVLAAVAEGGEEDVDEAVRAARQAFDNGPWPRMRPHQRTRYLLEIARMLEAHAEELAALITLDNGKPISEARGEVARTVEVLVYYAGWATKIYGETNPSEPSLLNYTLREPLGVCGQIIPWNGPLSMIGWKIGPALACANTVVLKPAEQTPLPALRFGQLALEAGLPEGVLNIITGFGPTAGAALARHPGVDKIAFTGSTEVGKQILQASVSDLKRVSLELGGKSPDIIFADADLESAVVGAAAGIFRNQGQVCSAGSRIFVQREIYDQFAQRLAERAEAIRLGDPFCPDTTMGPLVSAEQHERVLGYLEAGRREGAKVKTGGGRGPQPRGYFVKPTVFVDVSNSMKIAQEEIFGPVASLIPFTDEEDATLQGNDTIYGLAAGIWTRNISRAHKLARALKAGTVWVNCYGTIDPVSPFGGYKQSGIGRELGKHSLELYTQLKSVIVKL
jgi:acyl-CoA reductase-like NAD-dependent aldehyde dehydrogenase